MKISILSIDAHLPLPPLRRLHRHRRSRATSSRCFPEPAGLPTGRDADDHPRDELLRVHVHLSAGDRRHRRPHADLHAGRGAADGGTPDDRQHVRAGAGRGDHAGTGRSSSSASASDRRRCRSSGRGRARLRVDDAEEPDVRRRDRRPRRRSRERSASTRGDLAARRRRSWCRAACRSCSPRSRRAPPSTASSIDLRAYAAVCTASGLDEPAALHLHDGSRRLAAATKRSTAACSRRASASPRIRRPAAPAARSAATCSSTASSRARRLAHIVSLQGVKMLRPSRIHISIDATGDEITRVRVGGRSVLVGDGRR